jgi:hypothetical protein
MISSAGTMALTFSDLNSILAQNNFFSDKCYQFLKRSRLFADKSIDSFQHAGISFSEVETTNLRLKLKAITDEK